jgi:hypothetical protein
VQSKRTNGGIALQLKDHAANDPRTSRATVHLAQVLDADAPERTGEMAPGDQVAVALLQVFRMNAAARADARRFLACSDDEDVAIPSHRSHERGMAPLSLHAQHERFHVVLSQRVDLRSCTVVQYDGVVQAELQLRCT